MEVSKFLHEPCPCDKCDQAQTCADNEWACRAFAYFVRRGTFVEHTVRMPTPDLFQKIFREDDAALRNYLESLRVKEEIQNLLFD